MRRMQERRPKLASNYREPIEHEPIVIRGMKQQQQQRRRQDKDEEEKEDNEKEEEEDEEKHQQVQSSKQTATSEGQKLRERDRQSPYDSDPSNSSITVDSYPAALKTSPEGIKDESTLPQ